MEPVDLRVAKARLETLRCRSREMLAGALLLGGAGAVVAARGNSQLAFSVAFGAAIVLYPYFLLSRHGTPKTQGFYILHEGPIGVLGDAGLHLTAFLSGLAVMVRRPRASEFLVVEPTPLTMS